MTVPLWRRSSLLADIHTDTAVIGAGIAGLSVALFLQDKRIPAVILERHSVGSGASTRNAGYLMRGAADNYALAARHHGRRLASVLWRWTEQNLALLRTRGVASIPSYAARPSCLLALEPTEAEELAESHRLLTADGFDSTLLESHTDAAWRTRKPRLALLNPDDACVNPHDLLNFLRAQVHVPIYEHQEVAEVHAHREDRVTIRTTDATVHCRRAIVCVNAYAPLLLPNFDALVQPNRGQMLALHATHQDIPLDFNYYANRGSEYFRRADHDTIVLGGKRTTDEAAERTFDDRHTPRIQSNLEAFAKDLFGALPPVKARWAGTMGFTPDHLPLLGPVPNHHNAVWFLGGFTGHGMSLAHRCAKAAVDQLLGEPPTANPFPLARLLKP